MRVFQTQDVGSIPVTRTMITFPTPPFSMCEWRLVEYRQLLNHGQVVRLPGTKFVSKISKVIKTEYGSTCYHIEPNDPQSLQPWYFSHQFEILRLIGS